MRPRTVAALRGPLNARVRAVPSKSVTHRALVAAALAGGRSTIRQPLIADDSRVTLEGLRALGIRAEERDDAWIVEGCGGDVPGAGALLLGDSGTSLRLLLALACLGRSPSHFDGSARLRERPVQELAAALQELRAKIELTPDGGGLPLVAGGRPPLGGAVRLPASRSSQFASALLLVAARMPAGLDLQLEPPVVSFPYIELTVQVLETFGVTVQRPGAHRFVVAPTDYAGRDYVVEGDHSSASYFLAAAAICGGCVRVEGLNPTSAQADARLGSYLERLGCRVLRGGDWIEVRGGGALPGFDLDLSDAPDLGPTVAVLGLFAEGPSVVRGVAHLRLKESDRLEQLAANLRAMGRAATAREDRLEIGAASAPPREVGIRTASDHRIAMAFAVAGLRVPGVTVDDADCVSKSNPSFWEQLEALQREAEP